MASGSTKTYEEKQSYNASLSHLDAQQQLLGAIKSQVNNLVKLELPNCVSYEESVSLVAFCPQCDDIICADCKTSTCKLKQFQQQQASFPDEMEQEGGISTNDHEQRCTEKIHQNGFKNLCQTCLICQKCASMVPCAHNEITVEDKIGEIKELIGTDLCHIDREKQEFLQELELSKQNMRRLEKEIMTAKKEVFDEVQAQMKILQEHLADTIRTLDDIHLEQRKVNDEEQTEISSYIQQLDELRNQGRTLQNLDISHPFYKSHFFQKYNELFQKPRPILKAKTNKRNANVRYIPSTVVITQPLRHELGKIVEKVTDPEYSSIELLSNAESGDRRECEILTRNQDGHICCTNKGSIAVQIKDNDGFHVEHVLTKSTENGKFIVTFKVEKHSPYQISASIGGKAVKNSPKVIYGKITLKPAKIIGGEEDAGKSFEMNFPQSLAVNADKEAVIADANNDRILIFNGDGGGGCAREFGEYGTGEGKLCHPLQVAMCGDNILVCDNPDGICGRIQEFDTKGKYLRTLYSQEQISLNGMCVGDHHVAVCWKNCYDATQSGVKLLCKISGNAVHDILTTVKDKVPCFVAYCKKKYFISYSDANPLGVFDESGTTLYKLGDRGKDNGKFDAVRGLAVYGEDKILVFQSNRHAVQVWSHDGEFITSFGSSRGSGLGEMNVPIDAACTEDGKVWVLEHNGNRVQVWH